MRKNLLKLVAVLAFTFGLTANVAAQSNYNSAIGLRVGGYENGISLKHFISSDTALEGILGFRRGGFVFTGLYEKQAIAFAEPSLNWFYGAGAHIGGISGDRYYEAYGKDRYYGDSGILLGADGILGLEWQVPDIPIAASLDLHPRLELAKGPFLDMEVALTIRYTF
ncbi:hypothetical protein [Pedobacter arcticus]|uniref:hypothetical protein n=1 Tax=Pedobacter arcticus TaxID=752140 RepID=UPI0002F934CC|nr:hypothetical protein [Pedobacter arcticus]